MQIISFKPCLDATPLWCIYSGLREIFLSLSRSLFFSHRESQIDARKAAPLRLFIYLLSQWASPIGPIPVPSLLELCGRFLASFNFAARETDHTHCLLLSEGFSVFLLPLLVVQFQSGFFRSLSLSFCLDPPPLCASIMPLFALIMFPSVAGDLSLMPLSAFAGRAAFLSFQFCWFCKNPREGQREREEVRRTRKIFATSQSCLVVSSARTYFVCSPGPNVNNLFMVLFVYFFARRRLQAHLVAFPVPCLRSA